MNTYADAIRRQVEDAPRAALPAVSSALWRAYAEGHVSETEAEALSVLIDVRQLTQVNPAGSDTERQPNQTRISVTGQPDTPQDRQNRPRTGTGSRPRIKMPASSADAAGRPLAGFRRLSPRVSLWPSKLSSP